MAKIGFKFCQIPNKNLKICSNTLQMSQNGVFRQIQSHCTVHITHNFRNLKIFHQDEDPEGGHEPPSVVRRVHDQENDEGDDNDDINDQRRKLVRHWRRVERHQRVDHVQPKLCPNGCRRQEDVNGSRHDELVEQARVDRHCE